MSHVAVSNGIGGMRFQPGVNKLLWSTLSSASGCYGDLRRYEATVPSVLSVEMEPETIRLEQYGRNTTKS